MGQVWRVSSGLGSLDSACFCWASSWRVIFRGFWALFWGGRSGCEGVSGSLGWKSSAHGVALLLIRDEQFGVFIAWGGGGGEGGLRKIYEGGI